MDSLIIFLIFLLTALGAGFAGGVVYHIVKSIQFKLYERRFGSSLPALLEDSIMYTSPLIQPRDSFIEFEYFFGPLDEDDPALAKLKAAIRGGIRFLLMTMACMVAVVVLMLILCKMCPS